MSVTYPIAFSKKPTITAIHATGGTSFQYCTLVSPTATEFKVTNSTNAGPVTSDGADFCYIAIGV